MPLSPGTLIIVGLVLGAGGAITYATFHYAERAEKLTPNDLRPCLPWEGLPLPRFVYTKPELLRQVMKD